MSIYAFTALLSASYILLALIAWRLDKTYPYDFVFVKTLISKFRALVLSCIVVGCILSSAIIFLSIYYWNGASIGSLEAIDGYRASAHDHISAYLPPPWLVALIAMAIMTFISYMRSYGISAVRVSAKLASIYLALQPFINYAAIVCAFLSSFTFLTSSAPAGRSWVTFQLAEAREHASAIAEGAEQLAIAATSDEILDAASESLDDVTRSYFFDTHDSVTNLQLLLKNDRTRIGEERQQSADWHVAQLLASEAILMNRQFSGISNPAERALLKSYSNLNSSALRNLRGVFDEAVNNWRGSYRNYKIGEGIRALFHQNIANALVNQQFQIRGTVTGNPFADLLMESVTETAIERGRANLSRRVNRILER
ncbi:hypothetical protein IHQ71_15865 [Rhizobium sp. TH2]|uniref:hypothetical protein n=1 Tax=Rhizobium sp. TH2 TaxID=2775403 RepID=UPI0021586B6B|nr:hypothetical protein [Rhizobium sp. TH2]UVC06731.1 hypothetical protein IHQ71_15865 [Rhizobium sp. TH2]